MCCVQCDHLMQKVTSYVFVAFKISHEMFILLCCSQHGKAGNKIILGRVSLDRIISFDVFFNFFSISLPLKVNVKSAGLDQSQ